MKKLFLIVGLGIAIVLGLNLYIQDQKEKRCLTCDKDIKNTVSEIVSNPLPTETGQVEVPLPQEEDIVRNFFALINERKIPEAISSMSMSMVGDDSSKQAWGVQFNDIKSISVQKIEPSMPESWSDDKHSYKVTLEAYVSSDAANAPIPYYGWHDNPNIRWVEIVKEGGLWKINSLATGP